MKTIRLYTLIIVGLGFLLSISSCFVAVEGGDSGRHRGWYKGHGNPHQPGSSSPGKSRGRGH